MRSERNLINPDEIMRLPPTDLLVFAHGMPPYRGKKIIYYLDSRFKHIANLPVPETRNDILSELPPATASRNPWSDLVGEDYAITETFEDGAEHVPPRKKEGAAGSAAGTLEISPEAMLHPEQYFPPDPFEGEASGVECDRRTCRFPLWIDQEGRIVKRHSPTTVIGVRIEDGLLTRIDDVVRSNKNYKDRSQFLGAALREKLVKDFQDSELQAIALRKISKDIHVLDDKLSTLIELFGEFIFAFFMSSAPLPLDDKKRLAAIAIPAKRQYEAFLENFIDKTKKSATGLLSKLAADLIEEQGESHG